MPPTDPSDFRLEWIPLERISYHFFQPRKQPDREELLQLMLSIDRVGLLHPVLVRTRGDRYELISGHRRLSACRKLGWKVVPAIVRELTDDEALQAAVHANTATLDLQLMERCEAITYVEKVLPDETPEQVAQWFGVTDEFLAIARKLVTLPSVLRESIQGGVLNPVQAIELSRIEDSKLLAQAAAKVARDQLSPTATSVLVDEVLKTRKVPGMDDLGAEPADAPGLVERMYTALVEHGKLDAEALRAALRATLSVVDRSPEEALDLGYDPEQPFYLYSHVAHVARLTVLIGRIQGLGASDVAMLAVCALLHDVGMMQVPRAVLGKTSPLSGEERDGIHVHAEVGAQMLEHSGLREAAVLDVVRQHHERGEGSGYPRGRKGDQIAAFARIVAVADTYEALVSPRVYKAPVTPPHAVREIRELAARGVLDPTAVRHFLRVVGHFPPGSRVRLSTGETGIVTRVHATHPDRPVVRLLAPGAGDAGGIRTEFDLLASPKVEIVG